MVKKGIAKYGRPDVTLVIALDVSGSMGESLSSGEGYSGATQKLEVAKESLLSMLKELKDNDYIGITTFDTSCQIIFPITKWKQANAESLKKKNHCS